MALRHALLATVVVAVAAPVAAAPHVDLYTMGPGDELFSTFGHAALCVRDGERGDRCYNFGTADFSTPLPLTWDFVRGRARFWVSAIDEATMLAFYVRSDRTVYRQTLPVGDATAIRLARALDEATDERVKYYRYHHFHDNCTTRLRDLIDDATLGQLRGDEPGRGRSFRDFARQGFAGSWPLLLGADLLLGRPADRQATVYEAMFLPDELRAEVQRRLGAVPEVIHTRRRPLPVGATWSGDLAALLLGLALAALILAGARLRRPRLGALLPGLLLGLLGVIVTLLAGASTFPELRESESLLIFWPADLLLPLLPPPWRRRYASLRLALLALLALGHLPGWFVQPPAALLLPALPMLALWWSEARSAAMQQKAAGGA